MREIIRELSNSRKHFCFLFLVRLLRQMCYCEKKRSQCSLLLGIIPSSRKRVKSKMSTTTDVGSQVDSKLQGGSFCLGRPFLHIYPFLFITLGAQWEPEVFAQVLLSLPQDDSVTGLCLPLVGLPNHL